jgi:hypothetical protein
LLSNWNAKSEANNVIAIIDGKQTSIILFEKK